MSALPVWWPWWVCALAPDLPGQVVRQIDRRHELTNFVRQPRAYAVAWGLSEACMRFIEQPDAAAVAKQRCWAKQPGCHMVCYPDQHYPLALRHTHDPPNLLWLRGDPSCLNRPQLAIVGARKATPAAIEFATDLAMALCEAGYVVTSGLALGIDGAVHRGALASSTDAQATIAVLGTACDRMYPARHVRLASAIIERGALISELPLGAGPMRSHFPKRNRIISGMSLGTVVVEAGLGSGSLITAKLAADQGREVFAVPGAVANPMSQGCHQLLQQGAKLVTKVDDILEEFHVPAAGQKCPIKKQSVAALPAALAPKLQKLLECVDFVPTAASLVVLRCGWGASDVSAGLTALELDGHLRREGSGYIRV